MSDSDAKVPCKIQVLHIFDTGAATSSAHRMPISLLELCAVWRKLAGEHTWFVLSHRLTLDSYMRFWIQVSKSFICQGCEGILTLTAYGVCMAYANGLNVIFCIATTCTPVP